MACETKVPIKTKDPEAKKNYRVNWSKDIDTADSLASATFTVAAGLTKEAESYDAPTKTATVKVSGGTLNKTYEIKCVMTTTGGEILVKRFNVKIEKE